jgi:hypothetical protein
VRVLIREILMRLTPALFALLAVAPLAAQTDTAQRAYRLSLWGTVIPVAAGATWWAAHGLQTGSASTSPGLAAGPALLMAGGLIVGPTLGYSSAGLGGRGWRRAGLRTGLTLLSFLPAFAICGWDCGQGDREADLAWLTIATGTGLSLASAIYDISRLKHNVRRHQATRPGPGFSVAPVYVPGQRFFGVNVGVSF